jgi:hypothetical protein
MASRLIMHPPPIEAWGFFVEHRDLEKDVE